jgi:hypothetical protein
MVADTSVTHLACNEDGQSILEVVIVLPFLFLFVGLLFKVNLAIQTSINNTQFSHSQVFVLTANSPEYPRLYFTQLKPQTSFALSGQDMMVLGVSDPSALESSADPNSIDPVPQIQNVARNKTVKGSEDSGEQPKRTDVRIRNTAAICTQLNVVPTGSIKRWPFGGPVCQYKGMDGT